VVSSYNEDIDGIWFLNGHVTRLSGECSAEDLGTAVREALANSIPDKRRSLDVTKGAPNPVVKAFSLRSYKAYMQGARSISIVQSETGEVHLRPMRNEGRWFGYVEGKDKRLAAYSDATLGTAVREVLEQAE
jgi:hypothetical protein